MKNEKSGSFLPDIHRKSNNISGEYDMQTLAQAPSSIEKSIAANESSEFEYVNK